MTALITVCRSAQLTPAIYQFYCAILRTFSERGGPPNQTQLRHLARRFALPLAATLADLAAQDLLQLDAATGRIRAAYPFSGVPTPHQVTLSRNSHTPAGSLHERAEQPVFAMCALDALGIPLMLRRKATIVSQDALTHEPVTVMIAPVDAASPSPSPSPTTLDGWSAQWDPLNAVVYARAAEHEHEHDDGGCVAAGACCPITNFFTRATHAQQWAQTHPVSDGVILSPVDALHRAQALFGGVLHRLEEEQP
jgi:Alkylmercury lyase